MGYDSVFMYIDSSLAMYHQKNTEKIGATGPSFQTTHVGCFLSATSHQGVLRRSAHPHLWELEKTNRFSSIRSIFPGLKLVTLLLWLT